MEEAPAATIAAVQDFLAAHWVRGPLPTGNLLR